MSRKLTIFDYINSIYKKRKIDFDPDICWPAYLNLWMSYDFDNIHLVEEANRLLFYIPAKLIYEYYFYKMPKIHKWLKWIKKGAEDKTKEKALLEISKKYGISLKEAKEYSFLI